MAEKIQLKIAPGNDVADDDPFAELTRIMGFDPRQPVRQKTMEEPGEAAADEHFDIDLERELMGEFSANDDVPVSAQAGQPETIPAPVAEVLDAPVQQAGPEPLTGTRSEAVNVDPAPVEAVSAGYLEPVGSNAPADADANDLDDGFAADLDQAFRFAEEEQAPVATAPEPVAAAAYGNEHIAVAAPAGAAVQHPPVADIDDALAHEMQQAFAHVDAADEPDPISALADVFVTPGVSLRADAPVYHAEAETLESELLREEAVPLVAHHAGDVTTAKIEPIADTRSTLDLDRSIAESLADEFHAEEDFRVEPSALQRAASPEMDRTIMQSLEDEFQLDSDFPAGPEEAAPHALASRPQGASQPASDGADADFAGHFDAAMAEVDMDFDPRPARAASGPRAAPAAEDMFEDDLQMSFDDVMSGEIVAQPPVQARAPMAVPVPQATAKAPTRDDSSLEDELNALLGKMGARTAAAAKESVMVQKPQPAAANLSYGARREPASLGYGRSTAAVRPVEQRGLARPSEPDLDSLLLDELAAEGFGAAKADTRQADIDFDEEAFDAAFARSIAMDDLDLDIPARGQAASSIPAEPENWLSSRRAIAPEPEQTWNAPAARQAAPAALAAASYAAADRTGGQHLAPRAAAYGDVPDIDTVDVPERVVALADDLDIPDIKYDDAQASAPSYDDLDAEFASLINEMNAADAAGAAARPGRYDDDAYESGFGHDQDRAGAHAYSGAAEADAEMDAAFGDLESDGRFADLDADDLPGSRAPSRAEAFGLDGLDYDPDLDDEMSVPGLAQPVSRPARGRGLLVAGIVCAVAVAGGIGAFALSFGGNGSADAPVLVKADNAPIKVKPENPGGTVVPNQDNKVYDAVAKGAKATAPVQEKLVTNTEEPVDLARQPESRAADLSADDADAPVSAPKAEDRIDEVLQQADDTTRQQGVVAVAPRKVRTMVVKPDGSLVPREDTEPAPSQVSAAEPVDPAPQHVVNPDAQDQTGAVQAAPQKLATQPADAAVAAAKPAAKAKSQSSVTPNTVPLAPQRPSDQPVNVVGEVKPDQVASINPANAPAAAAGSWSMQIASQPTVENAQSTYQDLARRYAGVLNGRGVNIVKAEIAGKGTFYRVRVPAQSRNDAISLCTAYKAAGGNCFVSK